MASVFFSFTHADELHRKRLVVQLALLKQRNVIEAWDDHEIEPGEDIDKVVRSKINCKRGAEPTLRASAVKTGKLPRLTR